MLDATTAPEAAPGRKRPKMAADLRRAREEYDFRFDGGKLVQLITRRTVMQVYGFASVDAVRMFAKRHRIPRIMVGKRALHRAADWDRLRTPATSSPGPAHRKPRGNEAP